MHPRNSIGYLVFEHRLSKMMDGRFEPGHRMSERDYVSGIRMEVSPVDGFIKHVVIKNSVGYFISPWAQIPA